MMEFAAAVLRQLPQDVAPEQAQRWIQDQGALRNALRNALLPSDDQPILSMRPLDDMCRVKVNFSQNLKAMIRAGRYDQVDKHLISKYFPCHNARGTEWIEIELIKYDHEDGVSSEWVIEDLEQRGLRPATLDELCALGANYPYAQRLHPIVALSSSWRKPKCYLRVPVLDECSGERRLCLQWWDDTWHAGYRFAAVRKET
jgi:hypothetical protein